MALTAVLRVSSREKASRFVFWIRNSTKNSEAKVANIRISMIVKPHLLRIFFSFLVHRIGFEPTTPSSED